MPSPNLYHMGCFTSVLILTIYYRPIVRGELRCLTIRMFLMKILVFIFCLIAHTAGAQTLFSSEHDTPAGKAELNSFLVHCDDDCYFTMFLQVQRLDFESSSESGAMYRVWNENRDRYILFGIDANKDKKEAQIAIVSSKDGEKHILGASELGAFEGFRFEWKGLSYELKNLRSVPYENYSKIEDSGLGFKGELDFEPHSIEYLFLGTKVTQFVDATSQNINPELKIIGSGSEQVD